MMNKNKQSRGHWIYWHSEDMTVTFDKNRSEATNADAEPMRPAALINID